MKILKFLLVFLLIGMILSACGAIPATLVPPSTPTPGSSGSDTSSQVGKAAQQALAKKLGLSVDAVMIVSVEAVDWPDSCLGASEPQEMCAMVVTPGYLVKLRAQGQDYSADTNMDGSEVRFPNRPQVGKPTEIPTPQTAGGGVWSTEAAPAVDAAIKALSSKLSVLASTITVVSVEAVEWPDSCLGVQTGRACLMVITPGYKVILAVGSKQYEVHTDAAGKAAIVTSSGPISMKPSIIWQSSDQPCQKASITPQGVSYGPCQGVLALSNFAGAIRLTQLTNYVQKYQAFTANTPAGQITFNGGGQLTASTAEQRAIAEWSKLVFMEAQGGRSGAAWGLAFSWHREGGIAGFCDDLGVYLDGEVIASSCKNTPLKNGGHITLSADQLAQLYAWTDSLQYFDFTQANDPGVSDAMSIVLSFNGSGKTLATDADKLAILDFASQVFFGAMQ